MKTIPSLAKLSLFAIGITILVLVSTLVFEFGGVAARTEICQLVYSDSKPSTLAADGLTSYTNASTLIADAVAIRQGQQIPKDVASSKIIHQHWKAHEVPAVYHPLMASWRSAYPDWVFILWNDDDNLELVETFFPEWRNAYKALPTDTYRADFARVLYMYIFGGIYADLHSEALAPLEPILAAQASSSNSSMPIAFLGEMTTATAHLHSIPTSFMASSAVGHPLWLISAQDAVDWSKARSWGQSIPGPEYVTGPVALRRSIANYSPETLESFLPPRGSLPSDIFNSTIAPVMVFPPDMVYPSTWDRRRPHIQTAAQECVCWVSMSTFNPEVCKKLTSARWVINYWRHSA